MTPSAIPTFLLYGEDLIETPAQFAHIETIAARSSLHDWEIGAHRHLHNVQILLVSKGQVTFRCDDRIETLDGPCFMAVPIGSVHGFQFRPETIGYVLSLSAAFMARALGPHDPLLRLLTHGASGPVLPGSEERIDWICTELTAIQTDWRMPSPLFLALAEALVRSMETSARQPHAPLTDDARLSGFRRLIEMHLTKHRPITWYAEQLGITEKTLTRICRRRLDRTPVQLVHARLLLEAQRLLCFTNASVVQVANDLGFSDASYFSRFYRRMTGRRPHLDKFSASHRRG